jgi:hypothetical protein
MCGDQEGPRRTLTEGMEVPERQGCGTKVQPERLHALAEPPVHVPASPYHAHKGYSLATAIFLLYGTWLLHARIRLADWCMGLS